MIHCAGSRVHTDGLHAVQLHTDSATGSVPKHGEMQGPHTHRVHATEGSCNRGSMQQRVHATFHMPCQCPRLHCPRARIACARIARAHRLRSPAYPHTPFGPPPPTTPHPRVRCLVARGSGGYMPRSRPGQCPRLHRPRARIACARIARAHRLRSPACPHPPFGPPPPTPPHRSAATERDKDI